MQISNNITKENLRKRNKVMINILLGVIIATIISFLPTINEFKTIILVTTEIASYITLFLLYRKNNTNEKLPYILISATSIITLLLCIVSPDFSNVFMLFFILIISASYLNIRMHLFSVSITLILLIYMLTFQIKYLDVSSNLQTLSNNTDNILISYIFYYIIVTIVSFAFVFSGKSLIKSLIESQNNTNDLKNNIEDKELKIRQGVNSVSNLFGQMVSASNEHNDSFHEMNSSFQEMSNVINSQSENISSIHDEVSKNYQNIIEILKIFEILLEKSENAKTTTEDSNSKINDLTSSIDNFKNNLNQMFENVKELKSMTEIISKFNQKIREIADATNILSLNANIEASRAGEHGKGFSVIANEIRLLANQTKELSKQIEENTTNMEMQTNSTINQVNNSIYEMNKNINLINTTNDNFNNIYLLIKELNEFIDSNSSFIKDIQKMINDVSDLTQNFSASTEENAVTIEQLGAIVENLVIQNEKITNDINKASVIVYNLIKS